MANFYAHRENVGTRQLPQFQVSIILSDCGILPDGSKRAVARCATVRELDEQVDALIRSLEKARDAAKGILEENEGII
jgi:hypothetical protein